MNERIKELFQEAIDYADKTHTYTPEEGFNIQVWDKIRYTKFAELIVRECVKVMYDNAIERQVPPDINQTPTHYAVAVLEHFGVER